MKNVKTILTATAVASALLCGSAMADDPLRPPCPSKLTITNYTGADLVCVRQYPKATKIVAAGANYAFSQNNNGGTSVDCVVDPKNAEPTPTGDWHAQPDASAPNIHWHLDNNCAYNKENILNDNSFGTNKPWNTWFIDSTFVQSMDYSQNDTLCLETKKCSINPGTGEATCTKIENPKC